MVRTSVATMRDVAAAAGVAVTTVSRVVNGEPHVTPIRRARVLAAIEALNFRPNAVARTLRPGQRSSTIALVIEDVSNPFYSAIAHGVEEVAQARDHFVVLSATARDYSREERIVDEMIRRRVDGLLIVPSPHDHDSIVHLTSTVPTVYLDRHPRNVEADVVLLANEEGAGQALHWLIERGHSRIAYIGGEATVDSGAGRLAGYRNALDNAGIRFDPELVMLNANDSNQAGLATEHLLTLENPPTAIFSDNNRMTVGALTTLHRVGASLAVAGFDDVELAELTTVPLALVTHDAVDLGRRAAQLLFDRIDGADDPTRSITIPTSLVVYRD